MKWRLLLIACVAVLLVVFHLSSREIIERMEEYQAAQSEYAVLRERFGVPISVPRSENEPIETGEPAETTETVDIAETEGIDFDALRSLNPRVVGWLVVPGTSISYPIVQAADNERYLWHTFSGERNNSGAIFLDYRNSPDFSDAHSIIYGHNMRDGSMFAPLHGWTGDSFTIHTPGGVLEFTVFDRQTVRADSEIFALCNTDTGPRVVTLSTCVSGQVHFRLVVQGQNFGTICPEVSPFFRPAQ